MTPQLGVVMDPIQTIKIKKDSTFAVMLAAISKGWQIQYMEPHDIFVKTGTAFANMRSLHVQDDPAHWFELGPVIPRPLTDLAAILMRKDPPFNMEYIYTTYLLELAKQSGVLVINDPQSLRDANEKLFTAWFPQCCPPTLVTSLPSLLKGFLEEQQDIIVKPLDSMGGHSIFRVQQADPNRNVIFELMTRNGHQPTLAQRYIPEVIAGDKRILMIAADPVPFALARIPLPEETRANLAVGGVGKGVPLTDHDRWICQQVGPTLLQKGLIFVGLDVIGDYLTEINVTSPTGIRELDAQYNLNIGGILIDYIEKKRRK